MAGTGKWRTYLGVFLSQWDTRGLLLSRGRSSRPKYDSETGKTPVEALLPGNQGVPSRLITPHARSPRTTSPRSYPLAATLVMINESSRDPSLTP